MRRILSVALVALFLATPAFAAKLYLKGGGVIQAQRVWRSGDRVYVLATRDTMTSFEKSEVNMKRTFPKKTRPVKKIEALEPQAQKKTAAPNGAAEIEKPVEKKTGLTLPSLPKLPERTPESLVPSSGAGGTIKKQKKDMAEKLAE